MKPVFVVTGNNKQFEIWLKEKELNPKEFIFLNRIEQILGIKEPTIILGPAWYERDLLFDDLRKRGINYLELLFDHAYFKK